MLLTFVWEERIGIEITDVQKRSKGFLYSSLIWGISQLSIPELSPCHVYPLHQRPSNFFM